MKTAQMIVWTNLFEPGLNRLGHAGLGFDAAEGMSGADHLSFTVLRG